MNRRSAITMSWMAAADAAALYWLRPRFAGLVLELRAPHEWLARSGADGVVATCAAAALWLAAAWLGLGLLAAVAGHLPGWLGRTCAHAGRVLLPRTVQRLLAGSAGLALLLAPVAATAAPAGPPEPRPTTSGADATPAPTPSWPIESSVPAPTWPIASSVPAPTWPIASSVPAPTWPIEPVAPGSPTRSSVPAPTWPAAPSVRPVEPVHRSRIARDTPRLPARAAQSVHVRAGDSLWLIAARRLGPAATPAQIATQWPRWFAANRDVIGDDPALILPGQRLAAPANDEEARP